MPIIFCFFKHLTFVFYFELTLDLYYRVYCYIHFMLYLFFKKVDKIFLIRIPGLSRWIKQKHVPMFVFIIRLFFCTQMWQQQCHDNRNRGWGLGAGERVASPRNNECYGNTLNLLHRGTLLFQPKPSVLQVEVLAPDNV